MRQHRPLGTVFPHLQPKQRTNRAPIPDSSKGGCRAQESQGTSNCWCNSWKAVNRKGSKAEKGQWASSKWRARDSEHVTAGL